MKRFILATLLAMGLNSCTTNELTRVYGGTQTINLPCDQKVVTVTWKDTDIWYLTRPMREDEQPETFSFHEKSTYEMMEGTILLKECRK